MLVNWAAMAAAGVLLALLLREFCSGGRARAPPAHPTSSVFGQCDSYLPLYIARALPPLYLAGQVQVLGAIAQIQSHHLADRSI